MKSFFERLARVCLRQLPLFVMLMIYSVAPAFLGWYHYKTLLAYVVPQTVLPALLLCLLADRRRWLWWTVFVFASLLWLLETECWSCQGERMSSRIALIIAQSNPDESGEYLASAYPLILKGLGVWAACVAFFLMCCRLWHRISDKIVTRLHGTRSGSAAMTAAGVLLSLSAIYSPVAIYTAADSYPSRYWRRVSIPRGLSYMNTWTIYGFALYDTFDNPSLKKIPVFMATLESTQVSTGNARDSLSVVYVVGESFSRGRSSLYGYPYPTNPLMAKELADSALVLYDNVISLSHYTLDTYPYMMSTYDPQLSDSIEKYPLFPGLMKKAGYRVGYYDNQSCTGTGTGDIVINYFFTDIAICDLCFDNYNDTLYKYDGDLVDRFPPLTDVGNTKSLTIYHLMGQHMLYAQRYPESFSHFTADDYRHFDGLSDEGASKMAEYDNATRYNDYVIHNIIDSLRDKTAVLVYSPDHGDEVYDYRETWGRNVTVPLTSFRLYYEVPVMIWMSDSFRRRYPDVVAALRRNTHKAIYNSDLPHTILDIAGIETDSFNPAVSLLRDGPGRSHRHVQINYTDYDACRDEIYRQKLRYE